MAIVLAAVAGGAVGVGTYLLAVLLLGRMAKLRRSARAPTLDDVLGDALLRNVLFVAAAALTAFAVLPESFVLLAPVSLVLARCAPGFVEKRRKRRLQAACEGQLDTMADIIAMGLKAGMSFDAALGLYLDKFDGELPHEMRVAYASWTGGLATREQALLDTAERVGSSALGRFARTVSQALKHGSPLSGTLMSFAEEIRLQRHAQVERQVEKAPVKMLIPMGTCILPAMLILVMGPVVLEFMSI